MSQANLPEVRRSNTNLSSAEVTFSEFYVDYNGFSTLFGYGAASAGRIVPQSGRNWQGKGFCVAWRTAAIGEQCVELTREKHAGLGL